MKVVCCNIFNKNDKMCIKIKKKDTLNVLRNALEKRRNFNLLYFLNSNGNYISKEEEKNISFKSSKNIIYFTNVNTITIDLENLFLCKINFENFPLSNLRIQLGEKITSQHKFFDNDAFILDEENFKVFEICKNNVIKIHKISDEIFDSLKKEEIVKDQEFNDSNIKRKKDKNNENNDNNEKWECISLPNYKSEPSKLEHELNNINENDKNNNYKKNIKDSKRNNRKNQEKRIGEQTTKYNAFFNGEIRDDFPFFTCSPNSTLSEIRQKLPLQYKSYLFLLDGYPLTNEEIKISEIAKNNNVYLKYEKNDSLKKTISNNILNGCQKLYKNSLYEYYLYPNSKFNEEEEKECISLLLIGETGAGKTTFLNSLINFILKIDFFDNIRYLLVKEERYEQFLSQTKEVNIYHIKSYNSYPPIKIIDTPGFGDTSGHDFDKKIARMIFEKFKEIKDLNSVCIICKYNEERLDFSQRYIFNYIINLFGKDMVENFMILFTFCDVGKIISLKCFEEADSPFYEIVNKVKEPWYLKFNNCGFFAEKKNEIIEEFFKMGYESFTQLLNKLKSLKKKKLELSLEVNIKREKLDEITAYIKKQLIDFVTKIKYSNKEMLYSYYCKDCKFFSNDHCIICHKSFRIDYGINYFNFNEYAEKGVNILQKYYFEIYCNLFQLENIMKEYNNITLKISHETVKEFLINIGKDNNNHSISQRINDIIIQYNEYIKGFNKQIDKQKDFVFYLYKQLIKKAY